MYHIEVWVRVMVFDSTFNNISVLLVEESEAPGENPWPDASHGQTWSHNVVSSTPRLRGITTYNVGGDRHWHDSIGSCKSSYHMIMTTMVPHIEVWYPTRSWILFMNLVVIVWMKLVCWVIWNTIVPLL